MGIILPRAKGLSSRLVSCILCYNIQSRVHFINLCEIIESRARSEINVIAITRST